jgi:hypothetical protein
LTLRHPLSLGEDCIVFSIRRRRAHVISSPFGPQMGQLLVRGFNQQSSAFGSMAAVKTTRVKAQRSL